MWLPVMQFYICIYRIHITYARSDIYQTDIHTNMQPAISAQLQFDTWT